MTTLLYVDILIIHPNDNAVYVIDLLPKKEDKII